MVTLASAPHAMSTGGNLRWQKINNVIMNGSQMVLQQLYVVLNVVWKNMIVVLGGKKYNDNWIRLYKLYTFKRGSSFDTWSLWRRGFFARYINAKRKIEIKYFLHQMYLQQLCSNWRFQRGMTEQSQCLMCNGLGLHDDSTSCDVCNGTGEIDNV